jgi:hypothetical protein
MDSSFLREQAARCRRLADAADEFTRKRLLDLAATYDIRVVSERPRASKTPVNLTNAP